MMKVLVAEDDPVSRKILETTLPEWGFELISTADGLEAWEILQADDAPQLALIDWIMPGIDGTEICRKVRASKKVKSVYIMLLTSRYRSEDLVTGLGAGADDYIVKPFDRDELKARLQVGSRIIELQHQLSTRVTELEAALSQVKELRGLLPICSYCKKIRDDKNYWRQVETYFSEHTAAQFSHSICPTCYHEHVKPQIE